MNPVRSWARESRGLDLGVGWNVGLLTAGLAGLLLDPRRLLLLGLNPWVKPIKFDLSVLIYLVTVAVLARMLTPGWPRVRSALCLGIGVAMIVENSLISLQSLRGVPSHMNVSTIANSIVWGLMGLFILVNTLLVAVLWWLYLRTPVRVQNGLSAPVLLGARLGLTVFLGGSLEGVYMVARYNSHTVGARDGGPGLPFLNWSTTHGDLRAAHFFALHALQLFPLAGLLISRFGLPARFERAAVFAFAALYSLGVVLLFRQAIAAQPFLRL